MSSSANRPMRAPILLFGTVVILSTIRRHSDRNPFIWLGSTGNRNKGASVALVVRPHTVMDLVTSKRSSCRMTTGRGLPASPNPN